MRVTAVYACIRVIAETVASLPLPVYKKLERGKERDPNHPLYSVLHDMANDEMTSFQWRETKMAHILTHGNGYSYIERDGAGNVIALWPLLPDRTYPRRNTQTKKLEYVSTTSDGSQAIFRAVEILHIAGLGFNGVVGYSPIDMMRESIGLSMTLEEHAGKFFGNGARPGGILSHPQKLSDVAYERLKKAFANDHGGVNNSHKMKILEEGMVYTAVSIPNDQAQFLESRSFQKQDIYSMYRVPPHMVGDLSKATFSNIEQQSIDFVVNTIRPWLVRWEQAMFAKLLTPAEKKKWTVEFLVDGLLRGDMKSRYEAYAIGKNNGFLSTNDIKELENQNPVAGGDIYYVPVNMMPAELVGDFWKAKSSQTNNQLPK